MGNKACPVKTSKEWKFLVEQLGTTTAYKVFLHNKEAVPDMEQAKKYVATWKPHNKKANLEKLFGGKKGGLLKYTPDEFELLSTYVRSFNERVGYNALVAKVNAANTGMYVAFGQKKQGETIKQSIEKHLSYSEYWEGLSNDERASENLIRAQEGMEPIPMDEEGKPLFQKYSTMNSESKEKAEEKVAVLQKIFNVEVQYDTELNAAGAVFPTDNGPIIKINPDRLAEDTIIHEFGHIFIDALGGLDNGRVKAAVKQLENSPLWTDVAARYPELTGNDLAKEVLATALGMTGAEVFATDSYRQNWWTRFLDWFNTRIASKLGVEIDYVKALSKDLFNHSNSMLELVNSDIVQYSKSLNEKEAIQFIKKLDKEKRPIEKLSKEVLAKLKTKVKILHYNEDGEKRYASILKDVIADVEVAIKTEPALALYKFAELANNSLSQLDTRIEKNIAEDDLNVYTVNTMEKFASTFDDIDIYLKALRDNPIQGLSTEELEKSLTSLVNNKQKFKEKLQEGRKIVAVLELANNSNYAQGIARTQFNRDANELGLTGDEKDRYIDKKLKEESPNFRKTNIEFYKNMLDTTISDINFIEEWLLDATNISSHTIQIIHNLFNGASTMTRRHTRADEDKIAAAWKEFIKDHPGSKPSDIYKNLIEEGSDGHLYITNEYSAEFYVKYTELERNINTIAVEKGEDHADTLAALEAFTNFKNANTERIDTRTSRPISKWKNPKFKTLSASEKNFHKFITEHLNTKDNAFKGATSSKLGKSVLNVEGSKVFRLPSVNKSGMESLIEKGLTGFVKDGVNDSFKRQADDTDSGMQLERTDVERDAGFMKVFTTESGEKKNQIPVFFRQKVKSPSYDIPSLLLLNSYTMNNFNNKKAIEPKIDLLVQATGEKNVGKSVGFGKRILMYGNQEDSKAVTGPGVGSREYSTLLSIVEDNLYGVSTIDLHTTILGFDAKKTLGTLSKWTADSMLMLNYLSAGANLLQGKTMNVIERLSKGQIKQDGVMRGDALFWKDMDNWIKDIGSVHATSKTNLMLELFNIKGDYKALSTHFFKNNKAKALANRDTLHSLNHMGEYYTASTLMYSLLSDIKIMNDNKEYLDKDGKVVKNKSQAASLAQVYTVNEKGKLVISLNEGGSDKVRYTSRDLEKPYNPADVSNYLKKIYSDLHGQYDSELKAQAQRHVLGNMAFMLRKWMIPGMLRRYRGIGSSLKNVKDIHPQDKFYSQALMSEQEGNYTSAVRMVANIRSGMKELSFRLAYQQTWSTMSDTERANVRKTVIELSFIVGSFVASSILLALAKGIDDEDKGLKTTMFTMTFFTRRFYSELSFYANPQEALRMLRSPAASISMLESGLKLTSQALSDGWDTAFGEGVERYERGDRKGQPKIYKKIEQVTPIVKNLRRNIEESTDFLWNNF